MTGRPKLHDPHSASEFLNKPEGTLANWRWRGYGPAYIRVGRAVRYSEADLVAFLEANRVEPQEAAK